VDAARATLSEFDWDPVSADEAASLAVPSLVILGAQDRLLRGVHDAAARLPESRVVTLTGGHCVHEEHPEQVYGLITEFVR
jgi:pimeloyl-ACP methyl ester carboxylesterase